MSDLDTVPAASTPGVPGSPATGTPPVPRSARSPLPDQPQAYHHFLRTPRARWWRGVVAIVSLLVGFLLINLGLGALAIGIDVATGRSTMDDFASGAVGLTPMLFLANNLSLAALLPLSLLLQRACFGQPGRWLHSVQGMVRWRWLGRAALLVVPLWLVYVGVLAIIEPIDTARLSSDALLLTVVVLLTTPLQAAGEEYGFRGLIARSVGSWSADPRIALVLALLVSNLLFMVAHVATDPWLIAYYFVFGAVLGVIAWRTGGLEAPVVIHVVNNVVLLLPMALFGDLGDSFDRGVGAGGPEVLIPMAVLVLAAVGLDWSARRNRVARLSASA